jgi:hypothetical protein
MNYETQKRLAVILFFIICIGILGNLLNLFVFGQKSMRKMSTFRFLLYLSLVDLLVLLVCTSDSLLTYGLNIEIRLYSSLLCRSHTFLTYYLTHLSSIILMAVSIERTLVVFNKTIINYFLKKSKIELAFLKNVLRFNRIEKVVGFIAVSLALLNIHYLYFFNLNIINQNSQLPVTYEKTENGTILDNAYLNGTQIFENNRDQKNNNLAIENSVSNKTNNKSDSKKDFLYLCYPLNEFNYNIFLNHIWTWIDSTIYSFVPILVMIICSLCILIGIKQKNFNDSSQINRAITLKQSKRNNQLLIMLMATNLFFIVCTLPYCILSHKSISIDSENNFSLTLLIVHILAYSNNSFNFIFYGLFSKQYRQTALRMLRLKTDRPRAAITRTRTFHNEHQLNSGLRTLNISNYNFSNVINNKITINISNKSEKNLQVNDVLHKIMKVSKTDLSKQQYKMHNISSFQLSKINDSVL